ncbi:26S proteasome non-ATPase regulatory subunit 2 1B [Tetrabaena socialis]|uniref:26S proteasome non-ATPase regulatory subunit 2 1B n=1 Tax=Tetrabaena socialis TaxID=47790 RepID=A0A2J7ZPR4_9CHLO|nr:26S proteasome non-ATPase regulatory subunit 2 1B [Tetrabaena socialis]|eukprot:PNH02258.1 26S proteasome non-ATPase regulatory subunit 2 1B [Tetrabaena socialis]
MVATDDKKPAPDANPKDKDAKKDAKGKDVKEVKEELSEEDLALKTNLELMVERLGDAEPGVVKLAIDSMISEIRSATASMTSVPKPLKFLRPHYDALKATLVTMSAAGAGQAENCHKLADVISVLATTKELEREVLKYRLLGTPTDLGIWGHEYIRHLSGEIAEEYRVRREADAAAPVEDLMTLVKQIVPYHMTHNAEPEAVDLLLEVASFAALALGLVFNSSAREDVVMSILQALMTRSDVELSTPYAKLMCLALGLLFLGKQELAEATVESPPLLSPLARLLLWVTSEAGPGPGRPMRGP